MNLLKINSYEIFLEWEQSISMEWIKSLVRNSQKVAKYNKYLKTAKQ